MRYAITRIFFLVLLLAPLQIYASETFGTISHTQHFAWSNNSGWVNWDAIGGNVSVTDTALEGYLWSANHGWINLSPTHGGVQNDGDGNLSGFAWDSTAGWIEFTGVHIDANGLFTGETTANPDFGIMTFNCTHCAVVTDWRPLSVRTPSLPVSTTSSGGGGGRNAQNQNSIPNTPNALPQMEIPDAGSNFGSTTLPAEIVASTPPVIIATSSTTDNSTVLGTKNLFDVKVDFVESQEPFNWLLWIILALALFVGTLLGRAIVAWRRKKLLSKLQKSGKPLVINVGS